MDISLVITVKNNAYGLQKCIENMSGLFSELIVVDNNSTDNSLSIAKKYTNKIYFTKVSNNLSELKNIGIEHAKKKWILVLDSDEVCSAELKKNFSNLEQANNIEGFWFSRRNFIRENKYLRYGLFYPDYQLRLFRNNKHYKFIGSVHNQPSIPDYKTKKVNLDILHYQNPSKIGSLRNFKYLHNYIKNEALELKTLRYSPFRLIGTGLWKFFDMFFIALTRGKGILDGWDGVRAHFMFASSVFLAYIFAMFPESTIRKLLKTYE